MNDWKTKVGSWVQTLFLLAVLSLDLILGKSFLELVRFRALSGWESELSFDSLTFHWENLNRLVHILDGAALAGILSSFKFKSFYRVWGRGLSGLFLVNALYPYGIAFHYVTGFHFNLLLGILLNVAGFILLALGGGKKGAGGSSPPDREGKMEDVRQIDVAQAKELLDSGAVFVDVRDPASYEAAHIPGAISLNDANVGSFVAKADKKKPVVAYCYHGNTSQGAAAYLTDQGFQEVYSVIGGFERWRQTEKIES